MLIYWQVYDEFRINLTMLDRVRMSDTVKRALSHYAKYLERIRTNEEEISKRRVDNDLIELDIECQEKEVKTTAEQMSPSLFKITMDDHYKIICPALKYYVANLQRDKETVKRQIYSESGFENIDNEIETAKEIYRLYCDNVKSA